MVLLAFIKMNLSRDLRISKDRYFTKFRRERSVDYLQYSINFKAKKYNTRINSNVSIVFWENRFLFKMKKFALFKHM